MNHNLPLYRVDAYTDSPFSGNPAAICLLNCERDTDWMQTVAAEMNLSETAFQASKRGGVVKVRLQDDRVRLGGRAVTIFSGELHA